jgi:hypothetical protein
MRSSDWVSRYSSGSELKALVTDLPRCESSEMPRSARIERRTTRRNGISSGGVCSAL